MIKENNIQEEQVQDMPKTPAVVGNIARTVKYAFVGAILVTSLVGAYVLANGELRNHTIDFAQGQTAVQAEAPKAN